MIQLNFNRLNSLITILSLEFINENSLIKIVIGHNAT